MRSQRKLPAKRLFEGLAGREAPAPKNAHLTIVKSTTVMDRSEQAIRRAVENAPKPLLVPTKTVTELVEKQRAEAEMWEAIRYEGWQPGDDEPIVRSSRPRNGSNRTPVFQRYAFHLRSNGDRNARWDRGLAPHIYDSMSNHVSVRELERDNDLAAATDRAACTEPESIANVAQSMLKGFSTGVLSTRFDFTNPPRRSKPETAWIFHEQRFKFFITRKISDEAILVFERGDEDAIKQFSSALKAYVALYSHFRIGLSDKGFLEDEELEHQHFWTSTNALKKYRSRLLQEGLELFGTPADDKETPADCDPDRVARVWPVFVRVFRML